MGRGSACTAMKGKAKLRRAVHLQIMKGSISEAVQGSAGEAVKGSLTEALKGN